MAFWTGLEAITGHPAGAFKGMSMSDWFDNEKWQRMPRTWSGKMNPQGATESARQLDMSLTSVVGSSFLSKVILGRLYMLVLEKIALPMKISLQRSCVIAMVLVSQL